MAANIKDRHALTDTDGLATITNTDDQTAAAAVAANANTTTANTNEHDLTISANKQVSIANAAEQAVTRNQ